MKSLYDNKILAGVQLIHVEQMSLHYLIILRENTMDNLNQYESIGFSRLSLKKEILEKFQ